mmetsp:Transcript_28841/g.83680  ORF Transcript_28841/g.83680 Transcript_28841/m.83680 type:complete len:297 (-) Transcript_28841:995-1885(-)
MQCEQYSASGSHNGKVALEILLLGRSFATSLWGAGDGVLNQILGVGQKVVARLAMAGIRNSADVLTRTSNQIEQGCAKRSPFGQDLKVALQKILDNTLSVSARIKGLNDPSQPSTFICCVDELKPNCRGVDRSAHVLSYTLLVHTDRPGGLLMNRECICETREHRITCPDRFGRIYIRLVANLVGLDVRLELTVTMRLFARRSISRRSGPRRRILPSRTARARPTRRLGRKRRSPSRNKKTRSRRACLVTWSKASTITVSERPGRLHPRPPVLAMLLRNWRHRQAQDQRRCRSRTN